MFEQPTTAKEESKVEAFEHALFRYETLLSLMIEHPDWSAADISEVCENMWLDKQEETEAAREFLYTLEPELELFDREEAQQINRSR